jgi:hypothetical protein
MKKYSIRAWNENFEISQSRKIDGPLSWVAIPCKHDGLGFRRIMALEDGPAMYGAWALIVQVAAKCKPRGVLADERGPLTPEELSFKTGCPEGIFKRALEVLSSERVGWLVVEEWETTGSVLPPQDSTGHDTTVQDKTSKKAAVAAETPPELLSWIDWWNDLKREGLVAAGVSREPLGEDVRKGWKRVGDIKVVRQLLSDRDVLVQEIKASAFLREGWFTLAKLLGGKNRDGAYIVQRIVEGGYRDGAKNGHGTQLTPGKTYHPNATCDLE